MAEQKSHLPRHYTVQPVTFINSQCDYCERWSSWWLEWMKRIVVNCLMKQQPKNSRPVGHR